MVKYIQNRQNHAPMFIIIDAKRFKCEGEYLNSHPY